MKLIEKTENNTHIIYKIFNFKISLKKFLYKKRKGIFQIRNIFANTYSELFGLYHFKPKKYAESEFFKYLIYYKELINCCILRKISIPQIEFALTTKCTLKCKHCLNYMPYINSDEHIVTTIDDFKIQLDNLTNAVHSIKNLMLLGGEPLIIKNLYEYVEYAAKNPKVKNIWIITNGTIILPDELINVFKKYNQKVFLWLSNYSANPELKNKLKLEQIKKQAEDNGLFCHFDENLKWGYSNPDLPKRYRTNGKEYYQACLAPCISVLDGKMFPCPRGGVFMLKKIYPPKDGEIIDLNFKITEKQIIEFYKKDFYSVCDYCTILEDASKGLIMPAEQIK